MQPESWVCLLTGATGGIGRTLATAIADAGGKMVLSARDEERLEQLKASLPQGCVLDLVAVDLLEPESLQLLADRARQAGVNTLINLSGTNELAWFEEQNPEQVSTMITLNLTMPMLLTQKMLPHLLAQQSSQIVNVGSAFGAIGHPGYVAYCASKSGLYGFNEALRRELQDSSVRVIYVAPRATDTAMNSDRADELNTALGNACDPPDWVARQIIAAMRKRARASYLGWPERLFVKVNQLFPAVVDKSLLKQLPVIRRYARR